MAKKCARTFSIVVEKGKTSILDVTHLLPVGIARSVRRRATAKNNVILRRSWIYMYRTRSGRMTLIARCAGGAAARPSPPLFRRRARSAQN